MKVTIGTDTYDWDGEYTFQEGVLVEKVTGISFLDWLNTMNPATRPKGATVRITDIGVLLWVVARRTKPDLKFEDFDFPLDQWSLEGEVEDPPTVSPSDESST